MSRARGRCPSPSRGRRRWYSPPTCEPRGREARGGRVALLDLGDDHTLDDAAEPEQRDLDLAAHDPLRAAGRLDDLERAGIANALRHEARDRAPLAAALRAIVVELLDVGGAR